MTSSSAIRRRRYVMVDDKLRILVRMKQIWKDRLTTIFPRQGHYALDPKNISAYPSADLTIEHIGDLVDCDLSALLGATKTGAHDRSNHEADPTTA